MSLDYEGPEIRVLWHKTHRARKVHECSMCKRQIAIGQRYESRGWTEDGEFKQDKVHYGAYLMECPTQ